MKEKVQSTLTLQEGTLANLHEQVSTLCSEKAALEKRNQELLSDREAALSKRGALAVKIKEIEEARSADAKLICCCLRQVGHGVHFTHLSCAAHARSPQATRTRTISAPPVLLASRRVYIYMIIDANIRLNPSRYIFAPSSSLFRAEVDRQLRRSTCIDHEGCRGDASAAAGAHALMHHARRSPPKQCVTHCYVC